MIEATPVRDSKTSGIELGTDRDDFAASALKMKAAAWDQEFVRSEISKHRQHRFPCGCLFAHSVKLALERRALTRVAKHRFELCAAAIDDQTRALQAGMRAHAHKHITRVGFTIER